MEQRIHNLLDSIHFEAMQEYANLGIFPYILMVSNTRFAYYLILNIRQIKDEPYN